MTLTTALPRDHRAPPLRVAYAERLMTKNECNST